MARKVIWAPRATALLEEAANYVSIDSPSAARGLVAHAIDAAESLAEFSNRGRIVPELTKLTYRELLVDQYRLVYRVEGEMWQSWHSSTALAIFAPGGSAAGKNVHPTRVEWGSGASSHVHVP